jgi:L-seryl-tRNA(Ser) seleniumtransferase
VGDRHDAGALSELPAVHELAARLEGPHALAVAAARRAIDERRAEIRRGTAGDAGADELTARARALRAQLERRSLRRVLNASGVIVHTNLGRAPLSAAAREAVAEVAEGYSNLELELRSGGRGSRHEHVEALLCELTGAEAALAVNNGAAAVLLAAGALAGAGRGLVASRGQLVEIGGGFRVPEVVAQSGSVLIEVGTTNRTRTADYAAAIASSAVAVGAILRVHPSNFRTLGFVCEAPLAELCALGPPVIDDAGSGLLAIPGHAELAAVVADEPAIPESVAAGATLVCCSGDKLLGGPQAGLLVGTRDAVDAARRHPLARALRIDKLSLAALEATLLLYRDPARAARDIPVLAMLRAGEEELRARAETIAAAAGAPARIVRSTARVGGGALPLLDLEGPAVAIEARIGPDELARRLRACEPPVVGRITDGRLLLDPRTLTEKEAGIAGAAVARALSG